jgi:hypothetical protein
VENWGSSKKERLPQRDTKVETVTTEGMKEVPGKTASEK